MNFQGVMTAIVTPMQEGSIDEGGLRNLIRTQIESGVDAIVACGSTGEGATLSEGEHSYVLEIAVDECLGRVPVMAGIGARSTHGAIARAERARTAGVSALLVVTPAYNKPTQQGLETHFLTIAENTDLPVCLYNVPGRTSIDLQPETILRLAAHRNIVGIKEATGSMARASEIRRLCGPDFALLSGDDFTTLPFMALGGDGTISVLSNVAPAEVVALVRAVREGDLLPAQKLHNRLLPLCEALFAESNPIPVKTAACWLNIIPSDELRLPLSPLSNTGRRHLEEALRGAGFPTVSKAPTAPTLGPGLITAKEEREAQTLEMEEDVTP